MTGTGGGHRRTAVEAYRSRGVDACLSRPRFIITYRNCCHLPAICNRQVEDWLPTGFPSACCRGYRRLWGSALRMEYMYTCEPTLIVPGHPYQPDLHQEALACLRSLNSRAGQDITTQHNTAHTDQFILNKRESEPCTIPLFSTILAIATILPLSPQIMNRGTTLRGLLTPRSVSSPSCHLRAHHVYSGRRLIHGSSKRPHEALGTAAKQPEAEPIPVQTPYDRLTVSDIKERRAKAGKLVAGVAAYCDSDMFKAPVSCVTTLGGVPIGSRTKQYI